LDVGCGTCQVYRHLKKNGWNGTYVGIDMVTYDSAKYPESAKVIIGDALSMELPKSDTCVLHDVLEHVEDPVKLLRKCLDSCKNVLVAVPKRNEELWRFGIVEYHQLDKTHKHWGFTEAELRQLVLQSGGEIRHYKELFATELLSVLPAFTNHEMLLRLIRVLTRLFPLRSYPQEIWCVVAKA
jgi:2-polyprenyl-3-methyl-5-hydroxy-6-metoxy-1,4-benzoquinol methylase